MKARAPSFRRVVILALLTTVASTVLLSGAVFIYQVYRAADRFRTVRLQGVAEAGLIAVTDATNAPDDRKAEVWARLTADVPHLLAVMLLDGTGDVLFAQGDVGLLPASVQRAATGITEFRRWEVPPSGEPGAGTRNMSIGVLPVRQPKGSFPGGTLLLAVADSSTAAFGMREAWLTFVSLLAVGATGMLVGGWVLSRYLLAPLREISDQFAQAAQSGSATPLPVDRDDEIGRLARAFRHVQGGLDEWRQRATRLERTMDRRVNAETRRINAELKRVERKAWTDPLTGLANRRLFDEKLPDIFDSQQQRGHDLSVVMIDIDYFKNLNDSLGHAAGDDLLRFTGELLRQCLRGNDLAIRLGGDEFVLILPSASAADAACVAQRTVSLFGQRAKLLDMSPRPSMSAGVASVWEAHAVTAQELTRCADEALYRAKRLGRGRVAVYEAPAKIGSEA
jgi:diguanylate cyclase (GGDEF)-like protein